MSKLYPLKFNPIYKSVIWGGNKLEKKLNKDTNGKENVGESWEISAVQDNISVICNGFLAGNDLQDLIEIYFGDLVGEKVYEKFGLEFPLLIKFIDANNDLSIQVHPNDELSKKRHKAYGKTEMWYVLENDEKSRLISGFNQKIDKATYIKHLEENTLTSVLNYETVQEGDVFFIPAGRVHAIGAGILLAEIQQTSDITYRIYDYDRKGIDGNPRELHTDLAMDAIDFEVYTDYKTKYETKPNQTTPVAECPYFKTNVLEFSENISKDYNLIDSFIIYICTKGGFKIKYEGGENVEVKMGETVLVPAILKNLELAPMEDSKLLEVYIP